MVGVKDCEPRAARMAVEFTLRMQARTDDALEMAEPQPTVEDTLYHIAALADLLIGAMSEVVPDSSMKLLTMGSEVQAYV